MTTISIDIGYDSADTFRAKSAIVGKKKMMILFITTVILKTTRETQSLHLSVKFNIHIYKVELVTVEKIMAMATK